MKCKSTGFAHEDTKVTLVNTVVGCRLKPEALADVEFHQSGSSYTDSIDLEASL